MKGVGTIAVMGVLYWIAVGAAMAFVAAVVATVVVSAIALYFAGRLVLLWWQNTTPLQRALSLGSLLAGWLVAVVLISWWKVEYLMANFLIWHEGATDFRWVTIPMLVVPPLVICLALAGIAYGGDSRSNVLYAIACMCAVVFGGVVAHATTIYTSGEAQFIKYEAVCAHNLGGHTATYSVSASDDVAVKSIGVVLDDDTTARGDLPLRLPWKQTINIGEGRSCGFLKFELTRSERGARHSRAVVLTQTIVFDGHLIVSRKDRMHGTDYRGGIFAHDR